MECPICYSEFESGIVKPSCSHLLCLDCYTKILLNNKESGCPLCRKTLFTQKYFSIYLCCVIIRVKI